MGKAKEEGAKAKGYARGGMGQKTGRHGKGLNGRKRYGKGRKGKGNSNVPVGARQKGMG